MYHTRCGVSLLAPRGAVGARPGGTRQVASSRRRRRTETCVPRSAMSVSSLRGVVIGGSRRHWMSSITITKGRQSLAEGWERWAGAERAISGSVCGGPSPGRPHTLHTRRPLRRHWPQPPPQRRRTRRRARNEGGVRVMRTEGSRICAGARCWRRWTAGRPHGCWLPSRSRRSGPLPPCTLWIQWW